jgi:hypothetical protein
MDDIDLIDESLSTNMLYAEAIALESGMYDAIDNAIILIKKFISELRNKADKFISDVKSAIRRAALPAKLLVMKNELKNAKYKGNTTVKMVDYNKLNKYYAYMCEELTSYLKKPLLEQRYTSRERFQTEIEFINNKVDKFDTDMKDIMSKKITVPINTAISIVENELNGNTLSYKTFIKTLNEFDKLVADVDKLKRNSVIVSDDYLKQNHLNVFQRTLHRIGQKLSNWMSKIIRAVVFFFA